MKKQTSQLTLALILLLFNFQSFAQFDNTVSKAKLYDDALDIGIYIQMLAKDKLYLISGLKKEKAQDEFDYSLSKINEAISEIDINEDDPEIQNQLAKIKKFWIQFNKTAIKDLDYKAYSVMYFQINTFDRLISDLSQKMFVKYNFNEKDFETYQDIQKLRKLIQTITVSYYAKHLNLSQNFLHQYSKNIEEIDNFIKNKSNVFLNNPSTEKFFQGFILDWNFFRANLLHPKLKNPKSIFSLSNTMDYHLNKVSNKLIDSLK